MLAIVQKPGTAQSCSLSLLTLKQIKCNTSKIVNVGRLFETYIILCLDGSRCKYTLVSKSNIDKELIDKELVYFDVGINFHNIS